MRRTQERPGPPAPVVELRGGVAQDLAEYARSKVGHVLTHTGRPVLHARVRVTRHGDPARERPVVAQANVDVNGRPVRVQVEATTPREAVDLLVDRLDRRLGRVARGWEARRGRVFEGEPHEWRHDFPATPRRGHYPRPPAERRVVRHKTISPLSCTVDEAVAEMDDLDHDFHLFVEAGRSIDSVVYRAGPTGLRLAQVDGRADEVVPGDVPVTTSTVPAPLLDTVEAVDRLRFTGLPFLFYLDGDHGRGCVLYHRYDGHYGLIDPQAEATSPGPL
jgi:ribosome-associated translation inhibitor RaiA